MFALYCTILRSELLIWGQRRSVHVFYNNTVSLFGFFLRTGNTIVPANKRGNRQYFKADQEIKLFWLHSLHYLCFLFVSVVALLVALKYCTAFWIKSGQNRKIWSRKGVLAWKILYKAYLSFINPYLIKTDFAWLIRVGLIQTDS